MKNPKFFEKIAENNYFQYFIIIVILVNCFFIGLETYHTSHYINYIQNLALLIFTIEIVIRMLANPTKNFWKNGWNVFDFLLVAISFIPESLFYNGDIIIALRILRVFRIFRLLRVLKGLQITVLVLISSLKSLGYSMVFFLIFIYFYSILGVTLFKLPTAESMDNDMKQKMIAYQKIAPNAPVIAPDPYGSLDESAFTLFRILTGEDWTDIRYNLIIASQMKIIKAPSFLINFYHISWFIISAFLLLNLLVAAVVNNYNEVAKKYNSKG